MKNFVLNLILKVVENLAAVAGYAVRFWRNPSPEVLGLASTFFAWKGASAVYPPSGWLVLAVAAGFAAWMNK